MTRGGVRGCRQPFVEEGEIVFVSRPGSVPSAPESLEEAQHALCARVCRRGRGSLLRSVATSGLCVGSTSEQSNPAQESGRPGLAQDGTRCEESRQLACEADAKRKGAASGARLNVLRRPVAGIDVQVLGSRNSSPGPCGEQAGESKRARKRWTVSGVIEFGTSAMSHDERLTVVAPAPLSMT